LGYWASWFWISNDGGEHPFEENEEQRYIKFIRGDISQTHSITESTSESISSKIPWFEPNQLIIASRV